MKNNFLIIFFSVFLFSVHANDSLTLESIFIKNAYSPDALDDLVFFNKIENYALLEDFTQSQRIGIYNQKGEQLKEINLTKLFQAQTDFVPNVNAFQISNTDKFFLLSTNQNNIYRHSFSANYFLLNAETLTALPDDGIQYPEFSSDDKKIAYIKDNNIFVYDIKSSISQAITKDGKINSIINGKTDWVYEEEFGLAKMYLWNNQSTKIAYLKFDESHVKEYSFPIYNGESYPQNFTYKYPKVGEVNSKVSLWYYDVKKRKNFSVPININYEYLPRLYFSKDGNSIFYMLLNRQQNELTINKYNTQTKKTTKVYYEKSEKYIDLPQFVVLDNDDFLITSKKENYNQIYYYNNSEQLIRKVTDGKFNILSINTIDINNKLIYFETNKDKTSEQQIYAVNYETKQLTKATNEAGINTIYFSPQLTYYIHKYNNDTTPTQIKILNSNQTSSTVLIDNASLKQKTTNLPQKEFFTIPIDNQTSLEAWKILPPNFDSTQNYPLLMFVYGGPGSQKVLNEFGNNMSIWFKYLAEQGYVVACVDNRGCGGKSLDFEQITYLNLGKYETQDQIRAAKYLIQQGNIDSSRIGIFGWSYGGFLSLNCLAEGTSVFKTAISVAPVTNWIWYDNIYTERYMQTPLHNKNGYLSFQPLMNAHKIKGNLLLIHGTADDNVHVQHSIELMNTLNSKNIPYRSILYPDKNHGISDGQTRYNLFKQITDFILEKL